jgi:hypothetical protein
MSASRLPALFYRPPSWPLPFFCPFSAANVCNDQQTTTQSETEKSPNISGLNAASGNALQRSANGG